MYLLQPPKMEREMVEIGIEGLVSSLKKIVFAGLLGRRDNPDRTIMYPGRTQITDAIISDHSGTLRMGVRIERLDLGNYRLFGVTPFAVNGNKSVWECAIDNYEIIT